jgi:hypothetical protein
MNARLRKLENLVDQLLPKGDPTSRIIHSDGRARDYAKLLVILCHHVQEASGIRNVDWNTERFKEAMMADTPRTNLWFRYFWANRTLLQQRVREVAADPSAAVPLSESYDIHVLQEDFKRMIAQDEAALEATA